MELPAIPALSAIPGVSLPPHVSFPVGGGCFSVIFSLSQYILYLSKPGENRGRYLYVHVTGATGAAAGLLQVDITGEHIAGDHSQ